MDEVRVVFTFPRFCVCGGQLRKYGKECLRGESEGEIEFLEKSSDNVFTYQKLSIWEEMKAVLKM